MLRAFPEVQTGMVLESSYWGVSDHSEEDSANQTAGPPLPEKSESNTGLHLPPASRHL